MSTLLETFRSNYSAAQDEELSLDEYLDLCKRDPTVYATAAERMLAGIGEPEMVDTRNDQRLARLFGNRIVKRYPAFREFYGMEDAIEQIVAFFKHAAQIDLQRAPAGAARHPSQELGPVCPASDMRGERKGVDTRVVVDPAHAFNEQQVKCRPAAGALQQFNTSFSIAGT